MPENPAAPELRETEGDDGLGDIISPLARESGTFQFREWEIRYSLGAPTADDLNEKVPGD